MKFYLFLILIALMSPFAVRAEDAFIPGNIWYSKENIAEGDAVKIFTAIFNTASSTVSGTVEFYDKDIVLGKKNFSAPAGILTPVSIDWKVTAGDHIISAKMGQETTDEIKKFVPKTIIAPEKTSDNNPAKEKQTASAGDSEIIEKIQKAERFIADKTPEFIKKPVMTAASKVDGWRAATSSKIETDKTVAEKNTAKKPLEIIKLFLYKIGSLLFGSKSVFYSAAAILLLLILRLIWIKVL